jgi:protein SCO1
MRGFQISDRRSQISDFRFQMSMASAVIAAGALATASAGQTADQMARAMEGVDIVEQLGERIPLDIEFVDEHGNAVRIGDYFQPGRPVILTLNYYTCPMLCHMTLSGLVEAMTDITWTAGNEFKVITLTINPSETPKQAAMFKEAYLRRYGREGAENGWAFLTGEEAHIRALADAIGFKYRFVPQTGEYAHGSSIQFITPDGRISRYMHDVLFEPRDVRLALVEASQGTIGTTMDRVLLFACMAWDPTSGSYAPAAWKIMRSGGALTVVLLAIGIFLLWWKGSIFERKEKAARFSEPGLPARRAGVPGAAH